MYRATKCNCSEKRLIADINENTKFLLNLLTGYLSIVSLYSRCDNNTAR